MSELKQLIKLKDRLQLLSVVIAAIVEGIEKDSITMTREKYLTLWDMTKTDDSMSFEYDIRDTVATLLDGIIEWGDNE